MMPLTLIVAMARNGVIGADNALPWHLPEDLRRFKALTLGHSVIMGRKTWASLPERFRPLPGRRNIVVSRNPDFRAPGAQVALSLPAALACANSPAPGADNACFVIGGGTLYREALPLAQCIELTRIEADICGDTYFPPLIAGQWQETLLSRHQSAASGLHFSFVRLLRISAPN